MNAPKEEERFDSQLLALASQITNQRGPGLDPLLDVFFSFLRRKTDFFTGADDDRVRTKMDEHVDKQLAVVHSEQSSKKKLTQVAHIKDPKMTIREISEEPVKKPVQVSKMDVDEEDAEAKGKLVPNEGNGADLEEYSWTQSLKDLNVQIPIPASTVSKHVVWECTRTHMTVGLKNGKTFLKGKLFADVRPDDSHWTIEELKGVRTLSVHLDKVGDMQWWDKVVEGQPAINTKKVTPENSKLSDLDGETRQVVEKMMHDQKMKAMGKPSSEEQQKLDMLEKLKKMNPELDFSNVNMS